MSVVVGQPERAMQDWGRARPPPTARAVVEQTPTLFAASVGRGSTATERDGAAIWLVEGAREDGIGHRPARRPPHFAGHAARGT